MTTELFATVLDIKTSNNSTSLTRCLKTAKHLDQGSLARSIRAQKTEDLPCIYIEAYGAHCHKIAEPTGQILCLDTDRFFSMYLCLNDLCCVNTPGFKG